MFGQLGEMAGLMKKVGEMQSKMKQAKKDLEKLDVAGSNADGSVAIVISGDMATVKSVKIAAHLSGEQLELAVAEAIAKTLENVKAESAKVLSEAAGGLNLPGLNL
jgi:DNA-binding YbaB/EbfC family protein